MPPLSVFMQAECQRRGWGLTDFCRMLGRIPKAAGSKIYNGKQAPSLLQLMKLSKMFDLPVEEVIKMRIREEVMQSEQGEVENPANDELIRLYKTLPVPALLKFNWLNVQDPNDTAELIQALRPYAQDCGAHGLTRKGCSTDYSMNQTQQAWLLHVRRIAQSLPVDGEYSEENLRSKLPTLQKLMNISADLGQVVKVLSSCGIRLVLVECRNGKIDGVCTWLCPDRPVIGLTLRYDRIDNFWFTLRHELEHVLQGPKVVTDVDCELGKASNGTVNQYEDEANQAAQDFCLSEDLYSRLVRETTSLSADTIVRFAAKNGLNPSVLAGQVRHRLSKYNILTTLMQAFRKDLLKVAQGVDGWGVIPLRT